MKKLLEFIKQCLVEKKSKVEIAKAVAEHEDFKAIGADEFAETYQKAVQEFENEGKSTQKADDLLASLEKSEATENLKAQMLEVAKTAFQDEMKTFQENLKASLEAKKDAEPEHDYKSFIRNIVVVKDNTWRQKLKEMLKYERSGNEAEAKRISDEFLTGSKLYTEAVKATLTGDATTGSYAVPDEFSDMVFVVAQRASRLFDMATKFNMSSDKLNLLGAGDVTYAEIADQSTTTAQSEPTLTQTSLDLIEVGAYSELSNALMADALVDIVQLLANSHGRGLATYLKRATTVGNVATTGDLVNGIYSVSGIGSVAVQDGVNGEIAYDDLVNLKYAIDEVFMDDAEFEMNDEELKSIEKIKDNDGRPIFVNPMGNETMPRILGRPAKINNQMPATLNSSTGARTGGTEATILFGSASEVQIGIKGGFQFASSTHYKFKDRITAFLGLMRWDMAVVNASSQARLTGIQRT